MFGGGGGTVGFVTENEGRMSSNLVRSRSRCRRGLSYKVRFRLVAWTFLSAGPSKNRPPRPVPNDDLTKG